MEVVRSDILSQGCRWATRKKEEEEKWKENEILGVMIVMPSIRETVPTVHSLMMMGFFARRILVK